MYEFLNKEKEKCVLVSVLLGTCGVLYLRLRLPKSYGPNCVSTKMRGQRHCTCIEHGVQTTRGKEPYCCEVEKSLDIPTMQQTDSHSSSSVSSAAGTPITNHNNNVALTPAERAKASRRALEEELNDLLQVLFELSVIVYDFQPDGNRLVWDKVYNIVTID